MWTNLGTAILSGGNRGRGSTGDSSFLYSEYDGRADLTTNETNSWERDHSCNTGKITANGKH